MAHVRFTDLTKKTVAKLPAPDYRTAKRLYDYAVSCATADMKIELVVGRGVVKRHFVDFVETIPSVRDMPRYAD